MSLISRIVTPAYFASNHGEFGIVVEFDVSNIDTSDYTPTTYDVRRDLKVQDPTTGREYRPYEKFGGMHSYLYAHEAEIYIKKGAKPTIKSIDVSGASDATRQKAIQEAKKIEKRRYCFQFGWSAVGTEDRDLL